MTKWLVVSIALCGCEPADLVRDVDLQAARAGVGEPIVATDGSRLRASAVVDAPAEARGEYLRVTPHNHRLRIGYALFGVGAALATVGIIVAATAAPPSCSVTWDCWPVHLIASAPLGGVGGILLISGGGLTVASLRDAEVK